MKVAANETAMEKEQWIWRIRNIAIRDFRGIEKIELAFVQPDGEPSRLIVLGGPNGSGKTSILEACLLAAEQQHLVAGPCNGKAVRAGASQFTIRAEFQNGQHRQTNEVTGPGKKDTNVHFTVPCEYFSSWREPKRQGAMNVTAGKKGKRHEKTEENRLLRIKQYLINAKAFKQMQSEGTRRSQYDEVIGRMNEVWSLFYPKTEQKLSVEPAGSEPGEGFDLFLMLDAKLRISVDNLSSGQLEILCFAGSMLPEKEKIAPSIIVIDEPELHLDPQWHRLILRAMMKMRPECQFIVGTHSPEIYESAMSFQRHFLVPSNDPRAIAWQCPDGAAIAIAEEPA
jgi:predicted ATPase